MPSVFITGANRGIGLEFARQYVTDGWTVHGTARNPDSAEELQALIGKDHTHPLDVRDRNAVFHLADELNTPFDIIIVNSGIGGRKPDGSPQDFGALDYDSFAETLSVNTLGAMATAEAFTPHLTRSEHKKLVFLSSKMGSIDDTSSSAVAYRASKAALNISVQASAIPLSEKNIATVLFHPGWVQTDMGGKMAPLSVEKSVSGMRHIIAELKPATRTPFLDYAGNTVPW